MPIGSYCVHHILPASSRRPPSLTSQHEVWTEGKSDEDEEVEEEDKLRPLQPKCFWTSLNDSGWSVGSSVRQLLTHRPMVEGRWDRRWRRRETLANSKRERESDEDQQLEPRDERRSAEAAEVCGEKCEIKDLKFVGKTHFWLSHKDVKTKAAWLFKIPFNSKWKAVVWWNTCQRVCFILLKTFPAYEAPSSEPV